MGSQLEIRVTGMTCASCVARVEKALKNLPGVLDASVNLATDKAKLDYDPLLLDRSRLGPTLEKIGFASELIASAATQVPKPDLSPQRQRLLLAFILTLPLCLPMLIPSRSFMLAPWLQFALALPIQVALG